EGVEIDWDAVARHLPSTKTSFPAYPFERKRHWADAPTPSAIRSLPVESPSAAGAPAASQTGGGLHRVEETIRRQIQVMKLQLEMFRASHDADAEKKEAC
ncbi:MAG: hypothetical protein HYR88_15720, partial [Verrucomicrobia bacterium]|nr:hypothetical protein [Verrucomicrobiota bacterium]